jgi:Ser/Thr protein kinase RdoA (MazF antagonist)
MYYSQICHEHTLLTHLEKKNYPTVRLVRANDGETIIQNDGRIYAMFDYLDGYYKFDDYLYVPSQDSWFLTQMGLALSRLHYALRDFDPPEPSKLGFLSMDQEKLEGRDWTLEKLFQNRSASKELITNQTRSIHDRLLKLAGWIEDTFYTIDDQLTNSRPERCIIHGDFGPYNILVRPHSPLVVLDFELSRLDWRLVDLITAFSTTTAKSPSWLNLDKIRQILAGYQSGYPIPTEQLHLLPLVWKYQILRRIILSWSAYLERGEKHRENEIHKRLAQFQWVQQNQEKLARLA